ncbi:hypothetical protein FQA39_LY16404 [Lamprigera yunnana]|nr:hypothetical protein FQA39_LY16404 [Lamprigera yunnana]
MSEESAKSNNKNGTDAPKINEPSEVDPCIDFKNSSNKPKLLENVERRVREKTGLTQFGYYVGLVILLTLVVLLIIVVVLGITWPRIPHHLQFPICGSPSCLRAAAQYFKNVVDDKEFVSVEEELNSLDQSAVRNHGTPNENSPYPSKLKFHLQKIVFVKLGTNLYQTSIQLLNHVILTVIPAFFSKVQIFHYIPSAAKYMMEKTRNLKAAKGMFEKLEPCYGQNASKKDSITVTVSEEEVVKAKRYMTRSIKEVFTIYKKANPIFHIGRSKIYVLDLSVYCADLELCVVTLKNVLAGMTYDPLVGHVNSLVVCDVQRVICLFQECGDCHGLENIEDDSSEVRYMQH